jgi:NADH dehydrogenase
VRTGDARDAASLPAAVAGVETVISCMQFPNFPVENPRKGHTFLEVDARGNERLVAAARGAGVQTYVYLSGAGAAPDARYHWYRAKWQAEEAVRGSGLRWTIVRPSWVYGPEDKALNRFANLARRLPVMPVIGDGRQRLQPVFVEDVARVVVDSLANPAAANAVFEIGGPEVLTMDEVLRTLLGVMGKKRPLLHTPAFIPRMVGALLGLLPLPARPLSPDAVTFITMDALADTAALLRAFPELRLTPLREGLATYLPPRRQRIPGDQPEPENPPRHSRLKA